MADFQYDPRTRRYRTEAGWLTPQALSKAMDQVIASQAVLIRELSQRLLDGQLSLADWQTQMAQTLKPLLVALALASNGGLANTSQADSSFISIQIKEQYSFLLNFSEEIQSGKQQRNGTVLARAGQYPQAGRTLFAAIQARNARNANMQEERNVLGPADHCEGPDGCLAQAAKGWVSIGSLVPIGDRPCRGNCHCHLEYR